MPMAIVEDDVSAQIPDPRDVCRAHRGRDVCPEVLGELDRDRAHTTRARVDEDLLTGPQVRALDECLPRGQRDEG
jgi:hypothetical protein